MGRKSKSFGRGQGNRGPLGGIRKRKAKSRSRPLERKFDEKGTPLPPLVKRPHERSLYKGNLDIPALCHVYPELEKYLRQVSYIFFL